MVENSVGTRTCSQSYVTILFSTLNKFHGRPLQSIRKQSTKALLGILFLTVHHEATRHPAAPKDAEYPLKAGPIGKVAFTSSSSPQVTKTAGPHGASRTVLDFAQLPNRYRHPQLTEAEIDAVEVCGGLDVLNRAFVARACILTFF